MLLALSIMNHVINIPPLPLRSLEFDDLEMCTSLSNPQDYEGVGVGGWYQEDQSHVEGSYDLEEEEEELEEEEEEVEEQGEGSASLQNVVRDLRSQLSRCHKVIRSLQLRIRSLSATSDYASSLERTPRKVAHRDSSVSLTANQIGNCIILFCFCGGQ